ncbi:hypothetical protein FGRMN_7958 [Fusarium graminum]|nr:hypothetical protein FGRMN_7958 [Fusarium graminum]
MGPQSKEEVPSPATERHNATVPGAIDNTINRRRTRRFIQKLFGRTPNSLHTSSQQQEKAKGRGRGGERPAHSETPQRDPKGDSVRSCKTTLFAETMKDADIYVKPEDNVKKASGKGISEGGSVPAHVSNFPEISSTPFDSLASDPSKTHRSDTERLFSVEDVEAGAAILAAITDVCDNASGNLSRAEQSELRSIFDQMPGLLTREQREVDPEKAYQFLFAIYENPEAGNWGDIGALDDLETKLGLLECFDSRAEASPKRKGDAYVV